MTVVRPCANSKVHVERIRPAAKAFDSPNTCLLPELHSILDCSNSQIGTKTETLRKLKEQSTPFFLAIRVSFPPFPPKPPTTYLLTISEAGVFMRLC